MPHLPDDLVEEVFLRFPPDEPATLLRASLATDLFTSPAFRQSYREFHGAPPMMGFFFERPSCLRGEEEDPPLCFISTAKFSACVPLFLSCRTSSFGALDCRHGRVLLMDHSGPEKLVVWDPMTGSTRELMGPNKNFDISQAAVLCAMNGCDHRACHGDPFKIVCFTMDREEGECFSLAYVSSPEMGN
ncbi:unnamed protein product [Triticum turgidum subsp. durum]|uniref:F-box domain-containing protein n=1 Tax=Triticum turgidum subsp. durum TaxID=4567 RepID=A0A9R0XL19_TRITD|nr:unnamed protein product [Triticum turgidum subsp. durum]